MESDAWVDKDGLVLFRSFVMMDLPKYEEVMEEFESGGWVDDHSRDDTDDRKDGDQEQKPVI